MIRLRAVLIKEFIQITRDKMTLMLMFVTPIIQLLLFGFAVDTDVKHLPTVVFDQCLQQESRELLDTFTGTGYYDVHYVADSFQEVSDRIDSGDAMVGIVFPPDFAENLRRGRSASVQVIVDASDSMAANSAISTAQLVGQIKSQQITAQRLVAVTGKAVEMPYDVRIRPWYNPDFVSDFYIVPGIIGTVLTTTMVVLTSMAVVREKEHGTLEQLLVTPLSTTELLLGKIIPYIFIGYVQITIALVLGVLVFDIPIYGSLALLYALSLLFIAASLALGIWISTVSDNQMQAMQMSIFIILPSILLSGFMFPRVAMPRFFYYLSMVLPMTHYMTIIRGITLKGIGIQFLWEPTLSLAIFIIVALGFSIYRFRKTIA